MKIKSIIDVITNSSDEVYIIKNSGKSKEVLDKFVEYVDKHVLPDDPNWKQDRTLYPEVTDKDGAVELGWRFMCNFDSARHIMKECFGDENVTESYYKDSIDISDIDLQ